jgi:hypothetical protein
MDTERFERMVRALMMTLSRRQTLMGVAGVVLGRALGSAPSVATAKGKKGKGKGKGKKKRRGGQTAPPASPPPQPTPVVTYTCPEPPDQLVGSLNPGTRRIAQTFTATQTGLLHQIQFRNFKEPGSTGDYIVELLAVASNTPTNTVLATATIPNTSVADQDSAVTATFSGPQLVAGSPYAVAFRRPGGSSLGLGLREGDDCIGALFRQDPSGSGPFELFPMGEGFDLVTSVLVKG